MALTYDQLNSVSIPDYDMGNWTDQVYKKNVILDRLREGMRVVADGGTKYNHMIKFKELGQAKSVDPDDARSTTHVETRTLLEVDPKYAVCDIIVTWEEAAQNSGKHKIIDLKANKYLEGAQDMSEKISDMWYQTLAQTSGEDLQGILTIVQDPASTSTYAGIASGDAPSWVAGLYYASAVVLALYGSYSLEASMRACTFDARPNLITTTDALVGVYASKLQPGERRAPEGGKAGASDLYFQGTPLVWDSHCASGDMHFLNTDFLYLYTHPEYNFKYDEWADDPDRYNAFRCVMSLQGNFVATRRNQFGSLLSVS